MFRFRFPCVYRVSLSTRLTQVHCCSGRLLRRPSSLYLIRLRASVGLLTSKRGARAIESPASPPPASDCCNCLPASSTRSLALTHTHPHTYTLLRSSLCLSPFMLRKPSCFSCLDSRSSPPVLLSLPSFLEASVAHSPSLCLLLPLIMRSGSRERVPARERVCRSIVLSVLFLSRSALIAGGGRETERAAAKVREQEKGKAREGNHSPTHKEAESERGRKRGKGREAGQDNS